MKPTFFATETDFREWLDKNHTKETELLVGFYKTNSGKASITWPQSVNQALCYGWIDGVRKSFSEDSYTIRFTPRKPVSIWSAVNIDKMEQLQKEGLMQPAGLAAFAKRTEAKSKIYSHERTEEAVLPPDLETEFKANTAAWEYFIKQAPSYKKAVIHIIITAKQEKTIRSRFEKLVAASANGERLKN
ncbi:bacteriocin-protection protein [Flavobacterium rivuli WB 3.3-2 = DSM 21788]|uniref:Bacteriocin-protection protein n=1 Tax=Flavobacterium rivuli WB 3.3-2 = DSM 21788 TaxID=1121895 RepID=A0A0A2MB29_9FLAO|nr:YdeI/OmpD-associated family protein [Flavobacterium rivuli]KGO85490.1 bacteriocin-protection protein [Flavobacterium rivuli WB 3.3-2 = DSM 21788]